MWDHVIERGQSLCPVWVTKENNRDALCGLMWLKRRIVTPAMSNKRMVIVMRCAGSWDSSRYIVMRCVGSRDYRVSLKPNSLWAYVIEKGELLCAVWAYVITFIVYPNDEDFRFFQRCGYKPREALRSMLLPQKVPVDIGHIEKRKKRTWWSTFGDPLHEIEVSSKEGVGEPFG